MDELKILMADTFHTVAESFTPTDRTGRPYQSEDALEKQLIKDLQTQGYEYITFESEKELINNLRDKQSKLNNITFTDTEWKKYFDNFICEKNSVIDKTNRIQRDYIYTLRRDDGKDKNIKLLDKNNINNNILQVTNQYKAEGNYKNRYDVTILVNGLPLVHIELKKRGILIKEAFNQIKRYGKDSFWVGAGLFNYIQIFVISNGTDTKYFSNTVRETKLSEIAKSLKDTKTFEFTSYWADAKNNNIKDLTDFTKTFFEKNVILSVLTKYCVFNTSNNLLVMRPYQIVATERILNKIIYATNKKEQGTIKAGGYIWHTTGSGKTLTSFKTAQIARELKEIDRILFVVDRKDLDYQTMKEYDKFQKDCVSGSKSTKELEKKLDIDNPANDSQDKVIVTTIQKLSIFIKKHPKHKIYDKNVVIIFDECHRSQFGDMHKSITKAFKKYYLFGFTGTPIFGENATPSKDPKNSTTDQLFGDMLHSYTIINAIRDNNVLPFRIDYIKTIDKEDDILDKKVRGIDIEGVYNSQERCEKVADYILENYNSKTGKPKSGKGFNSIFAVSSVDMAIQYYKILKKKIAEKGLDLKIATIFSYSPNAEMSEDFLPEEEYDTEGMEASQRDFLASAMKDYNAYFGQSFTTDLFDNYYKDVSQRTKDREIDILIVCNMFLTGFDAPTLNTLWCDKFLRLHGLIQAFSRTNRILNSVKTYGNIVCFRNIKGQTDRAIQIFGQDNPDAHKVVLLRTFNEYYEYGYTRDNGQVEPGYVKRIEELKAKYNLSVDIDRESEKKNFINKYNAILRLKNILVSFDEFKGKEILSEGDFQDYTGRYLLYKDEILSKAQGDNENILDDIVFETELIAQDDINIDYILDLIQKFKNKGDKNILDQIEKSINSTQELRSKKDLIDLFIAKINDYENVSTGWEVFIEEKKKEELQKIIIEENLKEKETFEFMEKSFRDARVETYGSEIPNLLPKINPFGKKSNYMEILNKVMGRLLDFFERFMNL